MDRPLGTFHFCASNSSTSSPGQHQRMAEDRLTQLGRALRKLGIGSILALSPEAKGRIERSSDTFRMCRHPGALVCYHGTCLPDNMLALGRLPRMFLNPHSPNARVPSPRSVGSAACLRIRGSIRDFPSDR
jgi:hypothetical protein